MCSAAVRRHHVQRGNQRERKREEVRIQAFEVKRGARRAALRRRGRVVLKAGSLFSRAALSFI